MRRARLLVVAACMLFLHGIVAPAPASASDSGAGCHVVPPSAEIDPDTGTIAYSPGYIYCD
ncbi:MAG: hypothetical protein ACRDKB_09755 [Actinomycetota bacterium]